MTRNNKIKYYKPTKEKNNKKTKTKPKSENVTVFGSGRGNIQESGKNHQIRKKIPKIQNVEKTVLQSIIGQDRQVRQIITAIYRAINFQIHKIQCFDYWK